MKVVGGFELGQSGFRVGALTLYAVYYPLNAQGRASPQVFREHFTLGQSKGSLHRKVALTLEELSSQGLV